MIDKTKIGANMRAAREALGVSRTELANALGIGLDAYVAGEAQTIQTSREKVEKVWRGEWVNTNKEVEQICKCSKCGYPISYFWSRTPFCPSCGAPMTDEAVQMVIERLEGME